MFRAVMTRPQGHAASKRQGLYADLSRELLTAWIWAFPAAWKLCFHHPDVSGHQGPLPRRTVSRDWVVDFDLPPCWCWPQLPLSSTKDFCFHESLATLWSTQFSASFLLVCFFLQGLRWPDSGSVALESQVWLLLLSSQRLS